MVWFGSSSKKSSSASRAESKSQPLSPKSPASKVSPSAAIMVQKEVEPPTDGYQPEMRDGAEAHPQVSRDNSLRAYPTLHDDVEARQSFSTAGDTEEPVLARQEAAKSAHLSSLFNGHLMKWKLEAEEGSSFIRLPAFLGALGVMITAIMALVMYPEAWEPHSIVISIGVIVMSVFVLILDGRFLSHNPLSTRAHFRHVMIRNFNMFRFLWGRSLLYIVAGILNCTQLWTITICSGAFLVAVGVVALCVGIHASRKFDALRNGLSDESYLLLMFSRHDANGDGYIDPSDFASLLSELGMELDDRYTLKAFNAMDTDGDRKISYDEFSYWWTSGYIERGRRRRNSEDGYRQME